MNVQTAPLLVYLRAEEPNSTPANAVYFNLRKTMDHRGIWDFINENIGTKIKVKQLRTPAELSMMVAKFLVLVGVLIATAQGKMGRFVYNPWIAMTFTLVRSSHKIISCTHVM